MRRLFSQTGSSGQPITQGQQSGFSAKSVDSTHFYSLANYSRGRAMIDQNQLPCQRSSLAADSRLPELLASDRQRLLCAARREPRSVLGVVEFWLATAGLEGSSLVDT
jgi:hypothetical protein